MKNKFGKNYQLTMLGIHKKISELLLILADATGIKHNQFYELLASALEPYLDRAPEASSVKRDITRGIPQYLAYSDLAVAIEQTYQMYVSDPNRTEDEMTVAKAVHDALYPEYLSMLEKIYRIKAILKSIEVYFKDDFIRQLTADSFYSKKFFEEERALSKEEADFLVESVLKYPPKYFKKTKTKNKNT